MTIEQSVPVAAIRQPFHDLATLKTFVDFVLTRCEKWQPHGLCAQRGRPADYTVKSLVGTVAERSTAAELLCAGCPVTAECGIYALATTPPDCVVAGVPYSGHPSQRRRLHAILGLTAEQIDYLRDR